MKLLDRFRAHPEWQSDDPATRAAAIRDLEDGDAVQDLLIEIAREDDDPSVRRAAAGRIETIEALVPIIQSDPDPSVRAEAAGVLLELVLETEDLQQAELGLSGLTNERDLATVARSARLEPVSRLALLKLTDPRVLETVARRSTRGQIALEALARLDDTDQILSVALKAEDKAIAVPAFERLAAAHLTRETLEQIGKRAKQKAVRRRALAALSALEDALVKPSPAEGHLAVCEALEAMQSESDLERGRQTLERLLEQWASLDLPSDEQLQQRFASARSAVESRLATLESALTSARQVDEERDRLLSARESLCQRVEALGAETPSEALEQLRAEWDTLKGEPVDSGSEPSEDPSPELTTLTRRFEQAVAVVEGKRRQRFGVGLRLSELERVVTEMERRADAKDKGAAKHWSRLERDLTRTLSVAGGSPDPAPPQSVAARWERWLTRAADPDQHEALGGLRQRLDAARTRRQAAEREVQAERERSEQDNVTRILNLGRTAEKAALSETLQLGDAERQLRSLRRLLDDPGSLPRRERESALKKLRHAHTALLGRARELRDFADWQRWANLGVQEELCRRMEALVKATDAGDNAIEDAQLAEQFKDLMARWRQAADVPKDRGAPLWERFKAAHDVISPRCQQYFVAQDALLQQNLERQRAMVKQAESLAISTDWLKTLNIITELQSEWKALKPIPRHEQKELWHRFRTACNTFFTRRKADLAKRKQEWSGNLKRKEELCARVESLADSEDLSSAIVEVKQVQAEWKTVGPVRRNRSDAVWNRFRAACDKVFERLQAKEHAEAAERTAAREALCTEVEALLPTDGSPEPAADLTEKVQELQRQWREAPAVPPAINRRLTARFGQGLSRLAESYPAAFKGTALDPARKLKRLEQLCRRIEAIKTTDASDAESASPAEILATKWRDALASNLMGVRVDEAAERRSALDEVKRARADCRRLGHVASEEGKKLLARFHRACDRVQQWAERKGSTRRDPRSKPPSEPALSREANP